MKRSGIIPILTDLDSASNDHAIRHLAKDCIANIKAKSDWETEETDEYDSCSDDSGDFEENGDFVEDDSDSESESESESEDQFFDDIKSDVEALKREKVQLEADIEAFRMNIKEEQEEGKKLKANLQLLKKKLEKR
jgi:hypothetical protein